MTYIPKKKKTITPFRFIGGEKHPDEMDRIEHGRTALRVLQTKDGDKTLELFALGWRPISLIELRGIITAKPQTWRLFVRKHFPFEAGELDF